MQLALPLPRRDFTLTVFLLVFATLLAVARGRPAALRDRAGACAEDREADAAHARKTDGNGPGLEPD